MTQDPSVSVIIPLFRGEGILREIVERIEETLDVEKLSWELIVINDSDRSEAWKAIESLARSHSRVRGIDLMRNYGQHAAVLCGIRNARGLYTVTMDEDLEHPPEVIPKMIETLEAGVDVVYAVPSERHQGLVRRLASKVIRIALRYFVGLKIAFHASSFRAIRTALRDGFKDYQSPFVSIDALLIRGTERFAFLRTSHQKSRIPGSGYRFGSLVLHALDLVTGFSGVPIRAASVMGLLFTLFGVGTFSWVIGRYFILGGSVPGFPFLASIISIFSGVQLFTLGIIGEYVARIHFRAMNIPPYVIRRSCEG